MKIISWNINGIRAAYRKGAFQWLISQKPDFICLQETKADLQDIPEEIKNLKGYNLYLSPAKKKGYAGTAIYSLNKTNHVDYGIGIDKFDDEGRFLILEYPKYIIFNAYFPHTQRTFARFDFKLEFNKAYINFLKKIDKGNKPLILTGDYNYAHEPIDLANPKQNIKNPGFTPQERDFGDQLEKLGWSDIFRQLHPHTAKYTWWTYRANCRQRNIGWRIDYFFVKNSLVKKVKHADILDQIKGSDHCPILLDIKI
jgi:exodeoxyribonuclease III